MTVKWKTLHDDEVVKVDKKERDRLAQEIVISARHGEWKNFAYSLSGNTLIVAMDAPDGTVELYDCKIRRIGTAEV